MSGEESRNKENGGTLQAFENAITEIKQQIRHGNSNFHKRISKFVSNRYWTKMSQVSIVDAKDFQMSQEEL